MTSQYEFPTTNSVAEASVDYRFANTNKGFEDEVYEPVSCSQVPTSAGQQVKPSLPEPNPLKPTKKPKEDAFRFKWILIVVAIAVVVNTALAAAALGIAIQAGNKIDQVQREVGDIKSAVDELKRSNQQVDELKTNVTKQVTQISRQQGALDSRLGDLNENFNSAHTEVWQKLNAVDSRLGDLNENFDSAYTEIWQRFNNIRLVDGGAPNRGRVEILYDGVWGTICDDTIDYFAARLMCRLLGYNHAFSIRSNAYYGAGTGPIWLDNLSCFGNETTLEECSHRGWGVHDCNHYEDLSVECL